MTSASEKANYAADIRSDSIFLRKFRKKALLVVQIPIYFSLAKDCLIIFGDFVEENKMQERFALLLVTRGSVSIFVILGVCLNYPVVTPFTKSVAAFLFVVTTIVLTMAGGKDHRRIFLMASAVAGFLLYWASATWSIAAAFAILLGAAFFLRYLTAPFYHGLFATLFVFSGMMFIDNSGILWSEQSQLCWQVSKLLTGFGPGPQEQLGAVYVYLPWLAFSLCAVACYVVLHCRTWRSGLVSVGVLFVGASLLIAGGERYSQLVCRWYWCRPLIGRTGRCAFRAPGCGVGQCLFHSRLRPSCWP